MNEKFSSRDLIVNTAARLFFTQGYHATGMSQIIRESECPKGSLYYYFPDGKEEIAVECIQIARNNVSNELRSFLADTTDTAEGLRRMFERFIGEAEKKRLL